MTLNMFLYKLLFIFIFSVHFIVSFHYLVFLRFCVVHSMCAVSGQFFFWYLIFFSILSPGLFIKGCLNFLPANQKNGLLRKQAPRETLATHVWRLQLEQAALKQGLLQKMQDQKKKTAPACCNGNFLFTIFFYFRI